MAQRIINVTNISRQVIRLLCGEGLSGDVQSKFPSNQAGEISIAPNASTEIEESRLDLGQLEAFRRKGLITTTVH